MIDKFKDFLNQNTLFKKYFGDGDRGSFRNRRIFYTTLSALGERFVTILISLLSVPLTYNYLDAERFGAMMTIVSLVGTIAFADFGIGFGLQNRWAELSLDETGGQLKKAISTVFFFLLGIAILLFFIGAFFYNFIDLSIFFKVDLAKSSFANEINNSALVFFAFTALSFPFSIVQKIQLGKQEGYLTNIWSICASVLSLILLLTFTRLKLGIPYIIIALYGVNNIFIVINFIVEFYLKHQNLRPQLKLFDLLFLKAIIKDGLAFLVNQIGAMVLNTTNNLFLVHYHGAATVGLFNIGFRLVSFFLIPISAIAPYFLPALNDAFAKNDLLWLKTAFKKYFRFVLIYAAIAFLTLFLLGGKLIDWWLQKDNLLNPPLVLAFTFFTVTYIFQIFVSNTMLGPQYIHFIAKIFPFAVLLTTIFKGLLVPNYSIAGILYAHTATMGFCYILPCLAKLRREQLI